MRLSSLELGHKKGKFRSDRFNRFNRYIDSIDKMMRFDAVVLM